MGTSFNALLIKEENSAFIAGLQTLTTDELPKGDVLIKVKYSSLNFKDALSYSGNKGITKNYPHVPGIDAAGIVEESSTEEFSAGDEVICTGYDLGMNTWGGLSEYIRVPKEWLVKLPKGLSLKEAMIFGTSGFTAAQSLYHLKLYKQSGSVLVTGATGAVGSMAIALLSKAGFEVIAATRSEKNKDFLMNLGASSLVDSSEFNVPNKRPLLSGKYDNAIDTVGGEILVNVLKQTSYRGLVTCCGMIANSNITTSVFPFILRGVKLIGIDSAECPLEMKKDIWQNLANDWKPNNLNEIATEINLEEVTKFLDLMLEGKTSGKIIVKIQD